MTSHFRMGAYASMLALLAASGLARAEPAVRTLDVNVAAGASAVAGEADRFALDVPYSVDSSRDGEWTQTASVATWRFSIDIPQALSMSFHAAPLTLAPDSKITVRSGSTEHVYTPTDVHNGVLWSRISKGHELAIEITTPLQNRVRTVFQIDRFQVGYRLLDGSAETDSRVRAQELIDGPGSCTQNYSCVVTANNAGPAKASVALIIANQYECSGTLLNDVKGDNIPYVLTARHCQPSTAGAGNANSAADVTVYWNSLTPCGQALDVVYSSGSRSQTGAVTVVEQEDLWLIRLNANPVIDDAYYAGFDASGAVIQGGYTVHQGGFHTKQLANWFGQAASTQAISGALGGRYTSHFWSVVNQAGSIEGGASGSALFDQSDRVTGALSLGGPESSMCPVESPPAPDGHNGVAEFSSFAAAWNSTADTTSSTGHVTLKSVLDPDDSGTLVVNGAPAKTFVRLYLASSDGTVGQALDVNWNSFGATSCTATDGNAGDGWSGTLPAQGSQPVIESSDGQFIYGIRCVYSDLHVSTAKITATWRLPEPYLNFYVERQSVWVTRPVTFHWTSNVSPCELRGGSVVIPNLPSSGSTTFTETSPGTHYYYVKCGSGARIAGSESHAAGVDFQTPSVTLTANSTDRHVDSLLMLDWRTAADTCTPSGGSPGDGWTDNQFGNSITLYAPRTANVGTWTYRLTCTSGPLSAQAEVTVVVENDAPYVTFSASATTVVVGDLVQLNWKTNGSCPYPDLPFSLSGLTGSDAEGSRTFIPTQPGKVKITLQCFVPPDPPFPATPIEIDVIAGVSDYFVSNLQSLNTSQSFTLNWTVSGATTCTAAGGGADGSTWSGPVELPTGSKVISATKAGTFTYSIDCVGLLPRITQHSEQTVTVTAIAPPATGSNGSASGASGSGGGGAFDWLSLLALGGISALCWRRSAAS